MGTFLLVKVVVTNKSDISYYANVFLKSVYKWGFRNMTLCTQLSISTEDEFAINNFPYVVYAIMFYARIDLLD